MFDFSDLDPTTIGDGTGVAVPTGVYKGKISSCTSTQSKNTGRAQFEFKVQIAETPYNGAIRTEWISVPQSAQDKVVYIWARAFQSIGVSPEKLKAAGTIPPEQIPQFFNGKDCYIDFTAGNRDMGGYDKVKFITGPAYKVKKAAAAAAPVGQPAAVSSTAPVAVHTAPTPAPAPTPVPTAPANGSNGSNDLLAMLNG
jgi:hypothetical protein